MSTSPKRPPQRPNDVSFLEEREKVDFLEMLSCRKVGSVRLLARRAGVSQRTIRSWLGGQTRIRRSTANKVRRRLGVSSERSSGLARTVSEIRESSCPAERKALLCKAASLLAQDVGYESVTLRAGNSVSLSLGSTEVVLGFLQGEPCYRILDDGVLRFEGTLGERAAKLLQEFLQWRDAGARDARQVREKISKQYDRFQKRGGAELRASQPAGA